MLSSRRSNQYYAHSVISLSHVTLQINVFIILSFSLIFRVKNPPVEIALLEKALVIFLRVAPMVRRQLAQDLPFHMIRTMETPRRR